MNLINIYYDYVPDLDLKSHVEVENCVIEGIDNIYTLCTRFFSFKYLSLGYEVIIHNCDGKKIVLSELFENKDYKYTSRKIREGHNIENLLLSGEFIFN